MKIENQVTCKELSQKMEELGFEQESLWYWCKEKNEWRVLQGFMTEAYRKRGNYYHAYTVAELGEMLPNTIKIENRIYMLKMDKFANEFFITYFSDGKAKSFQSNTEADCRAKMLIWLKESGYL